MHADPRHRVMMESARFHTASPARVPVSRAAAGICAVLIFAGCAGPVRDGAADRAQSGRNSFVPPPCRELTWQFDRLSVRLCARRFVQGEAAYLKIDDGGEGRNLEARFGQTHVVLDRRGGSYHGYFALGPGEKPGRKVLTVSRRRAGRTEEYYLRFTVADARFPSYRRAIDLGRFSVVGYDERPEVKAFIEECSRKKKQAFERHDRKVKAVAWAHPLDSHVVTSPFWARRLYQRYRIRGRSRMYLAPGRNHHGGLDLRGREGDPVYAMADGKVALAEMMFYEGNFVVIHHGGSVFSCYMHLHSMSVRPGRRVRAGELIGRVGATGVATGSHLHVSIIMGGAHVDPLSVLSLPAWN